MDFPLRLREANKKDLKWIPNLLKSNNLCFEDVPPKINLLSVAYAGSRIVGIGGVEVYGNIGLLRSVVIKEQLRGKGLGKALVSRIIESAKARGIKELYLLTTTAESFFGQLGFLKIRREAAPAAIKDTTEFKELCAVTSILMAKRIA